MEMRLVARLILAGFVAAGVPGPATHAAVATDGDGRPHAAAPSTPAPTVEERAEIRDIITRQIDAFRMDDAETAFSLAAPGIRRTFITPERFMIMVRAGYQAVYRPRVVEFRDIVSFEDKWVQAVYVVGPDGVPVIALYPMERQADGRWLIGGCHLVPTEEKPI
jgi:hypothetical protein